MLNFFLFPRGPCLLLFCLINHFGLNKGLKVYLVNLGGSLLGFEHSKTLFFLHCYGEDCGRTLGLGFHGFFTFFYDVRLGFVH